MLKGFGKSLIKRKADLLPRWDTEDKYVAAARDAQIHREGIGRVVDEKVIPSRSLKNSDNASISPLILFMLGVV